MLAYLDTEFTSLEGNSRLISIALVTDGECQLYLELVDGWSEGDCSAWVRQHVLPLLDRKPEVMVTRAQAAQRIESFLAGIGEAVTLLYDSAWDEFHLKSLLRLPENATLIYIREDVDPDILAGYFGGVERGIRHHALVDAHALAYAHRLTLQMRQRAMASREDTQ